MQELTRIENSNVVVTVRRGRGPHELVMHHTRDAAAIVFVLDATARAQLISALQSERQPGECGKCGAATDDKAPECPLASEIHDTRDVCGCCADCKRECAEAI